MSVDFKPGDIVKLTRHIEVDSIDDRYIFGRDAKSDQSVGIHYGPDSSAQLEVVKRAVRKLKVGDEVTGDEIRERQWKRGTIVGHRDEEWVLHGDGRWYSVNEAGLNIGFHAFLDLKPYVVKRLP
ncbi:MAG: hypothetical protein ACXVXZ_13905 [Mycobacteriaceae bacterium]